MRKAFTLVELLVVIGMLAVMMGAISTGVSQARKRTQIAKATQDAKEITNAILAYQNFAPDRTLANEASGGWKEASEGNLAMILGKKPKAGGGYVPVLYNAQLRGGRVMDPWGRPYEFMIKRITEQSGTSGKALDYVTAPSLPNYFRLTDRERQ